MVYSQGPVPVTGEDEVVDCTMYVELSFDEPPHVSVTVMTVIFILLYLTVLIAFALTNATHSKALGARSGIRSTLRE